MSRTFQVGKNSSETSMIPSTNTHPTRPYPRARQAQIPPRIDKRSAFVQMSRSVSHESGWNSQPMRVGVVQPQVKNASQNLPTQAIQKEFHEPTKAIPPRPPREPTVERSLPVDPWRLLPEQKKYYIDEFYKLQKDPSGFYVAGPVARDFFMKSKLPNDELIHIWELADLDQDGRLTKIEYCLAFHLTVARRNGYPLPTQIPESLYVGLADLQEPIIENESVDMDQKGDDDNWETFSEKSFSTVSSASTLPNFAAKMRDSESICQPVPMRMTPSSLAARNNPYEVQHEKRRRDELEGCKILPPTFSESSPLRDPMESKRELYLKYPHRTPADGSSSAQSTSSSSSPVSDRSVNVENSSDNLSYSSSKPLKNSDDDDSDISGRSSPIETTTSTQENFADFRNFDQMVTSTERLHLKSSQSSPNALESNNECDSNVDVEPKSKSLPRETVCPETFVKNVEPEKERKIDQVRSMVDSLRERNSRLARLNQALSLELKDLISERVSLETRCDL